MASIAQVAGMVMFWLVETLYMLLLSLLAAVWTLPLQYLCYYVGYAPEVFSAAVAPMKERPLECHPSPPPPSRIARAFLAHRRLDAPQVTDK